MGLFSKNENMSFGYSNYVVEADESYTYPTGAGRILAEAAQNDLNMFSALIARDFEEAAYIQEGYGGFSPEVITEGVGDIFTKIHDLLLKLLAKIKGLFKSFMAKFDSVVIKDNKKYFEKYKTVVNDVNVKWSGFKCKFSKPKSGADLLKGIDEQAAYTVYESVDFTDNDIYSEDAYNKVFEDDAVAIKFVNALAGIKITELSDFDKEYHEKFFEDEEEIDDRDAYSIKGYIEGIMSEGDKYGKTTKKTIEDFEKAIKNLVRLTEKDAKELEKIYPSGLDAKESLDKTKYRIRKSIGNRQGTNFDNLEDDGNKIINLQIANKSASGKPLDKNDVSNGVGSVLKTANAYHKLAQVFESSTVKVHTAFLNELKFTTKQARTVYAAMAAHASRYKNKVVADNSAALLYVAQEAAGYEFDSDFELA